MNYACIRLLERETYTVDFTVVKLVVAGGILRKALQNAVAGDPRPLTAPKTPVTFPQFTARGSA
jgi:hypothetical protein